MVTRDLTDYIERCLDEKFSEEDIRNTLLQSGWDIGDVSDAFLAVKNKGAGVPPRPELAELQESVAEDPWIIKFGFALIDTVGACV